MTDNPTIERKTARRHRARSGMGVYVTDQELIEYLGLPADLGRKRLLALDGNPQANFPRKQPFWGDRRYLPAVEQWLDQSTGAGADYPAHNAGQLPAMPLAPLQLPLYSLPDEVGPAFIIIQGGINSGQRPFGESGRRLFVVDPFSTHAELYLISSMLTSPTQCDIMYLLDGRTDMKKAPKVGSKVRFKGSIVVSPCIGTVEKIWPKRICLNDQELIDDPDAMPRYGGPAPESDWQVTFKPDMIPAEWPYMNRDGSVANDKFCPPVSELEAIKSWRRGNE